MKKSLIISLFALLAVSTNAQQFIQEGQIEYEVRVNTHRQLGDGMFAEQIKNQIPQFATSYYKLNFNKEASVYQYSHKDEKSRSFSFGMDQSDKDIWYNNYANKTFVQSKFVFDNTYLLSDSLMNIEWKLVPNETREIAGFNCRKAQGIIFDSVYVFAFYTDEIVSSGGPMGLTGLPGMILGVTIPRTFTSWIATKVQVAGVKNDEIKAPTKGKAEKASTLKTKVEKALSDWGEWGQQAIWKLFL